MNKFWIIVLVAVVVTLGGLALRSFAAKVPSMPQVGQTAPGFTLPNQEGQPVSLTSQRGKWVVLYFYPKDMSYGCSIEAHNFQRDIEKYHAANAVILGVSLDTVKSHKKFCTKDGLGFTLLSDHKAQVSRDYGVLGNYMGFKIDHRVTFLINPQGNIVKVWRKVSPSGHSEQVLAELKEAINKDKWT
uniref:thioredoxin-dependent peroxiredoxin n=1 Tax=Acidobacterium capsulatum TaxID=33075 RepID=A0A7V4XTU3_9BACT